MALLNVPRVAIAPVASGERVPMIAVRVVEVGQLRLAEREVRKLRVQIGDASALTVCAEHPQEGRTGRGLDGQNQPALRTVRLFKIRRLAFCACHPTLSSQRSDGRARSSRRLTPRRGSPTLHFNDLGYVLRVRPHGDADATTWLTSLQSPGADRHPVCDHRLPVFRVLADQNRQARLSRRCRP